MEFLAGSLSGIGNLNRPVLDQTGLTGNFDFVLEFAPEIAIGDNPASSQPDPGDSMFCRTHPKEPTLATEKSASSPVSAGMLYVVDVDIVYGPLPRVEFESELLLQRFYWTTNLKRSASRDCIIRRICSLVGS